MKIRLLFATALVGLPLSVACGELFKGKKHGPGDPPDSQEPLALKGELEHYQNCGELRAAVVDSAANLFETQRLQNEYYSYQSAKRGGGAAKSSAGDYESAPEAMAGAVSDDASTGDGGDGGGNAENTGTTAAKKDDVGTNLQEVGVDEPDQIKLGKNHVFVLDNQRANTVQVAVARKESLKFLGTFALNDMQAGTLYASGDRLVVAGQGQRQKPFDGGLTSESGFWVRVYDSSTAEMPTLVGERFFRGTYVDSRLTEGRLVLVFNDAIQTQTTNGTWTYETADSRQDIVNDLIVASLADFDGEKAAEVPCTSYTKTPFDQGGGSFTRVVSLDVASGEIASEIAVPGVADRQLYMSANQIVLAGRPSTNPVFTNPEDSTAWQKLQDFEKANRQKLEVIALDYDATSGALDAVASTEVAGYLKPFGAQWAFKTLQAGDRKLLALFTTTGSVKSEDQMGPADNHFYVLEAEGKELKTVAGILTFAATEDIRAIRYSGAYAFVVTFQRTDPLFAIDLTDPLAPHIAGELKMPGFSTYLHPVGDGRLLGVGYDTEAKEEGEGAFAQGVQASLFDATKAEELTRLDNEVLGKRGSYTEAAQDSHAFYFDPTDKILGLPLVTFNDDVVQEDDQGNTPPLTPAQAQAQVQTKTSAQADGQNQGRIHQTLEFSGAVFYKVTATALEPLKKISHYDAIPTICRSNFAPLFWINAIPPQSDVRRVFRSDDQVYTVSNFVIRSWNASTWAQTGEALTAFGDCQPTQGGGGFE